MKPLLSPKFYLKLSQSYADPFSKEYDYNKLTEDSLSNREKDIAKFIDYCNKEYHTAYGEVTKLIKALDLPSAQLIDFIFCAANIKTLMALPKLRKQMLPSSVITAEALEFAKYKNAAGHEFSISLLLEVTGDITAYLLGVINTLDLRETTQLDMLNFQQRYLLYDLIWYRSNQLLNLEQLYGQIKFENASVDWLDDDKKIKISSGTKDIEMIRRCGEIRKDKNLQECLAYLFPIYKANTEKKISLKKLEVVNNEVILTTGMKNVDFDGLTYDAHYIARYYYYSGIPLEFYDGLGLNQINDILKALITVATAATKNPVTTATADTVPYKIKTNNLIKYLSEVSSFEQNTIRKVLDSITSREQRPFPWRKPLYDFEGYYYFTLSTFTAPNPTLIFEEVLRCAGYGTKENELLLCGAIASEMEKESRDKENRENDYTLEKIDTKDLIASGILLENQLLYKLRDYYILLEAVYYEHPITAQELNATISLFSTRVHRLTETMKQLAVKIDAKVVPIFVGNHLSLSGLSIEDICIIDLQMISNYFVRGSFGKAQLVLNNRDIDKSHQFASLKYYRDEDQFNDNFLEFINFPPQISTVYNKLIWKDLPMSLPKQVPQIKVETMDIIPEEDTIASEIRIVKNMLDNKKYLDYDEKKFTLLDESIAYHVNDILHKIAFKDYDLTLFRTDLFKIISKSNFEGFSHMVLFLNQTLANVSFTKIKDDKKFKGVAYTSEEVVALFKEIIQGVAGSDLAIDTFSIPAGALDKQDEKKIVTSAIDLLSAMKLGEYNDNSLDTFYLQVIVLNALRRKYGLDYEFLQACSNYISILNFNKKFQRARNFGEQILMVAIPENKHYMGWSLLYKCFTEQENPYYASIYGTLFNISLTLHKDLKYSIASDLLALSLKFFRTFRLYEMMEQVMEAKSVIKLSPYDDQKLSLIYFQGNLLKTDRNTDFIDEAIIYLNQHFAAIVKFGDHALLPWLNFLYNIKRISLSGIPGFNKDIDHLIGALETALKEPETNVLKKIHFDTAGLKKDFIGSLLGVYETYDSDDFRFEIRQLEMQSKRLLLVSLDNNDMEGILLSSLVLNDNSSTYKSKYHQPHEKVKSAIDLEYHAIERISKYKDFIDANINLKKGELFIWLFNLDRDVYVLTIDHEKDITVRQLPEWDWKKMRKWLKDKKDFYFVAHHYYDLREQEEHYDTLLQTLAFTELSLTQTYDEIYFCSSIDLVQYPGNLIVNNGEFLSASAPFTNVISFESFINGSRESFLSPSFTSTAWIPTVDNDGSILVSYDNLKPALDSLGTTIINERYITGKISTDLNIFLAHGEVDITSFKGIYTNHESESAITHPELLFGSGEVAILFICNSGVANDDIFSNAVLSLCHDILKLGYKTVIAPFWKLEISITAFWFDAFIDSFRQGYKISEAVYLANASLAAYKPEISTAFHVAEGRLDMHIYGNPNIRIGTAENNGIEK